MLFLAIPINYVPLKFPSPCCVTSAPYAQLNCVLKENMADPDIKIGPVNIWAHYFKIYIYYIFITLVFILKYKCT